ncbi:MAG: DUF4271 domain-containing protein [Eudoraea sp.]|nr:DUF4271 domain-containing protein [Eudoraea sp.]
MEPVYRTIISNDWVTLVILISLVLLVIAKILFASRFMTFIILPFNSKYIFMYNKKDRLIHGFHLFMTAFQILNFSLYLYWILNILAGPSSNQSPLFFLMILGLLLGFILLKIILQLGNAVVFDNYKTISEFIFKKLSYLNYSSGIMFISNVIFAYINPESLAIVYLSLFLILTVNMIGWFTLIKSRQKFITAYFFYFILYLCALEIAPFVIIAKYLNA